MTRAVGRYRRSVAAMWGERDAFHASLICPGCGPGGEDLIITGYRPSVMAYARDHQRAGHHPAVIAFDDDPDWWAG